MSDRAGSAWYVEGLAFECSGCGGCCITHDEYAYVYLSEDELAAAANHLRIPRLEFISLYCDRLAGRLVFRFDHPECPMLRDRRCIIYPVRPVQCMTWPFWPENLASREAWERHVVQFCPGAGQGRVVSLDEIRRHSREMSRSRER